MIEKPTPEQESVLKKYMLVSKIARWIFCGVLLLSFTFLIIGLLVKSSIMHTLAYVALGIDVLAAVGLAINIQLLKGYCVKIDYLPEGFEIKKKKVSKKEKQEDENAEKD